MSGLSKRLYGVACLLLSAVFLFAGEGRAARLKDIAYVEGVRPNQLVGYGLVVGLNGTGDKTSANYTMQSISNMLNRMGMKLDPKSIRVKNTAAVLITADLPPFAKPGARIDVIVSSLGDATSLQGGTLIASPLKGHDGTIYATAQGPVALAGFSAGGGQGGSSVTKNHQTAAKVSGGAIIEKEVPVGIEARNEIAIMLRSPDFTTAERVALEINKALGATAAVPVDAGKVAVAVPQAEKRALVSYISRIEGLSIEPDTITRVIVNERTGTVVIGENVKIATVAISHGDLSIEIKTQYLLSQPAPFSPKGVTVIQPVEKTEVKEERSRLIMLPENTTLGELVRVLNLVGVTPRDLIAILQAIKAAGALQADIEII
ncbi:MAG: flagellar basal body P-ring protein FlgI [Deltaproteobacteria bacterium]|nr:flagellar basal body P-ring protein FlgI [Deltaproteobacteria bacterium]MBI5810078.1 flagellar basal body P-ring protein FlgI [Deltaproteobacteria bacterium]